MADDEKPIEDNSDSDKDWGMSEQERAYIKRMLERLMEAGIGAVYGDEDASEDTVVYDHGGRKEICRAICCSFIFALTEEEVDK